MAVTLSNKQYKASMVLLFIVAIGFTAAMIATVGVYWVSRVDACNDASYEDCGDRTHEYLFGEFRNITMKFFVDCINMFFILLSLVTAGVFYNKLPRSFQNVLIIIILALSIWSLACGIKSIDEEDETNVETYQARVKVMDGVTEGEQKLASNYIQLQTNYEKLKQLEAANKATPNNPQIMGGIAQLTPLLKIGQQKYDEGVANLEVGKIRAKAVVDGIDNLEEKYNQYRKSVMALVLINFVAIFCITFLHMFQTPMNEFSVKIAKLENITTHEQDNLKQNKNVEVNAQNAM